MAFQGDTGTVYDIGDVVRIGNGKVEWTVTDEWMINDPEGNVLVHVRAESGAARRVPTAKLSLIREGPVAQRENPVTTPDAGPEFVPASGADISIIGVQA
jgi:hypothetical protein